MISPHGRGVDGAYNLRFWGDARRRSVRARLAGRTGAAAAALLVGYAGQIDDLARMPELAPRAFPWLEMNCRTYAIGSSMGAQESLLLLARRDTNLAGVVAFDPVTDMAARYRTWPLTPGEHQLPALARTEFGGSPAQVPQAYAARSPASRVRAIAGSDVPLQLWWSRADAVVTDQARQTGAFYSRLHAIAPARPGSRGRRPLAARARVPSRTQLRAALACFHLVPAAGIHVPAYVRHGETARSRTSAAQRPPEGAVHPCVLRLGVVVFAGAERVGDRLVIQLSAFRQASRIVSSSTSPPRWPSRAFSSSNWLMRAAYPVRPLPTRTPALRRRGLRSRPARSELSPWPVTAVMKSSRSRA